MKREKFAAFTASFLLGCMLSVGTMGAMVTGLDLPVDYLDRVYTACAVCALAGCGIFLFKRGWIAALAVAAAGLAYLWQEYYLSLPIRALISRLSWYYDSAYGWGVLEFVGVNWREVSLDLPLAAWGCLTALSAAWTVMQGRGLSLTLVMALLPVCTTVVVTNTVPDPAYLYVWLLSILLLLLTATVRQQNPGQGAVLTAMTALPVAALLALLFHAWPKDTYVNRSEEYLDQAVSWIQSASTISFDNTGLISQAPATPNASATANLSRVGPRNTWGYTVMEAEADYSGTVYLRGQDFDSYSGTAWTATEDRTESFGGMPSYGSWTYDGNITIYTTGGVPSNVLYIPYYPTEAQSLTGGRMENTERRLTYSFSVRSAFYSDKIIYYAGGADGPATSGSSMTRYTSLPSDTRRWAVEYLNEHFETNVLYLADDKLAHAIADHVRGSAVYDTNTPRMSGDYEDFAQWFLEESDTGYCVHFASAATVLLRAAGIPARYVTGYMFTVEKGETVEVTADQAHAWVEYYDEALAAWVVLEPTPADLGQDETEPPETQPAQTESPTEAPTEDEEQTRPDVVQPGDSEKKTDLTWLWTALKWLLAPVVLWLAVLIQYTLRRRLRRTGHKPNARALGYWADVENLCRFTKQAPPAELEDLAQKAKFSQHTLTEEELQTFRAWLNREKDNLKQKPWYVRFVCKYVLILY